MATIPKTKEERIRQGLKRAADSLRSSANASKKAADKLEGLLKEEPEAKKVKKVEDKKMDFETA